MKIACYIRVKKGSTEKALTADMKSWLKANGHTLRGVKWFVDKDAKDGTIRRDNYRVMREAALAGQWQFVVVLGMDNLNRKLRASGVTVEVAKFEGGDA